MIEKDRHLNEDRENRYCQRWIQYKFCSVEDKYPFFFSECNTWSYEFDLDIIAQEMKYSPFSFYISMSCQRICLSIFKIPRSDSELRRYMLKERTF